MGTQISWEEEAFRKGMSFIYKVMQYHFVHTLIQLVQALFRTQTEHKIPLNLVHINSAHPDSPPPAQTTKIRDKEPAPIARIDCIEDGRHVSRV